MLCNMLKHKNVTGALALFEKYWFKMKHCNKPYFPFSNFMAYSIVSNTGSV